MANNLMNAKPMIDSMSNIEYTKVRDNFSNYGRLQKRKEKEVVEKNEKMFNRLLNILQNEKANVTRFAQPMPAGPNSLNIHNRRMTIDSINYNNMRVSKKLTNVKCVVPSMKDIERFNHKYETYKGVA